MKPVLRIPSSLHPRQLTIGRIAKLAWLALPLGAFLIGQSLTVPAPSPRVTLQRVGVWTAFGPDRLLAPTDVSAGPGASMVITDRDAGRVYRVGLNGRLLASAGGEGQAPGRLRFPCGVSTGPHGHVYVADCLNSRVGVFDRRLRYLRTLQTGVARPGGVLADGQGGAWISAGEFTGMSYPLIHVDARGRIVGSAGPSVQGLPSQDGHGRIWIVNRMGEYDPVLAVGADGSVEERWGGNKLRMPEKAVHADGMVFVGDRGSPSLHVFDTRGRPLGSAPPAALRMPDGRTYGPYGLAFDRQGYLWACFLDAGAVARFRVVGRP